MTSPSDGPLGNIIAIFWRSVTASDFFSIERSPEAGPRGGGGQLYIDIPLSRKTDRGLYFKDFGVFFSGQPLDDDSSNWGDFPIPAYSASDPVMLVDLVLAPRGGNNFRYKISNQNRQATGSHRHPAWSADRGFPQAPDDVSSKDDPRIPDLSFLKVYIARTDTGNFIAGYTNSNVMPGSWPRGSGLEVLFEENNTRGADGIVLISHSLQFSADHLGEQIAFVKGSTTHSGDTVSPGSIVRRSIIEHPAADSSEAEQQEPLTPRPDLSEAIRTQAPQASSAEDWIEHQLVEQYGRQRVRRIGHTNLETIPLEDGELPGADIIVLSTDLNQPEIFIEVKSSRDVPPSVIQLTASELRRAKQCANEGIPFGVRVVTFSNTETTVVEIPFEGIAIDLTIDDLVTLGVQIKKDGGVDVPSASQ